MESIANYWTKLDDSHRPVNWGMVIYPLIGFYIPMLFLESNYGMGDCKAYFNHGTTCDIYIYII